MSLFSKNLRFLRKKGSYNQEEISFLFNKKANTVGNWENQKSEPNLAELMKLGEYFKSVFRNCFTPIWKRNPFNKIQGQ
jgi:transcriptional regulator with XRE-family HTH domain